MRSIQKKSHKRRIFAITASILILSGCGYLFYAHSQEAWPFNEARQTETETSNTINYEPPTEQEVEDSQSGKKNSAEETKKPTAETSKKTRINIGVSFADVYKDNVEIRAFTPSVVEGTGTCTVTLMQNPYTIKKESKAFIESTSSICNPIIIPLSEFTNPGPWSIVVNYTSPTSIGESARSEVIIP